MDTNPDFKSFLNELCPNGGPLQEIIIYWPVLPTIISLLLFVWNRSGKKFPIPIFNLNNYQIMLVGKTQNVNVR